MSYQIKIENKYGDQLQLTDNPNYKVKATGLSPVDSNIITASVANYGGERYVSSRQQKRNIVLTIYVCEPVEKNRINLYKYIRSHDWIRVYFKNGTRDVYIDGYVESFELDHFSQTQAAQVSIICPQPNFIDINTNEAFNSRSNKNFYLPFNTSVQADDGTELLYTGLGEGVLRFSSFLATPETKLSSQPTPNNPVDISGIGFLSGGVAYARLVLESNGKSVEANIPLGEQVDNVNLIYGAESLVSEHNDIISNIFTDELENVMLEEGNQILHE